MSRSNRTRSCSLRLVIGPLTVVLCSAFAAAPTLGDGFDWATGPSIADEEGKRDWGVEVVPYLWLAGLQAEMGIPAVGTIPVTATFSQLAQNLDAAFAGIMDARYRRWHLLVDGAWVSLAMTGIAKPPFLPYAELDVSVAFGTVAAAYELPLNTPYAVDVYLAARWWQVSSDALVFTAGGPVAGGLTEAWADAIVGVRIRYSINEKWRVGLTGDVGAGNSSIDWQVFGYTGYMFTPHFGLTAGYRVLGVDYSRRGFLYNARQMGLLLGINFAY